MPRAVAKKPEPKAEPHIGRTYIPPVVAPTPPPTETVSVEEVVSEPPKIEEQITAIYEQVPVVRTRPARGKPIMEYYKPSLEQEQKIIELVQQLPPEKRAKYIVEPPPAERERVSMMGTIMERVSPPSIGVLPPQVTRELRKIPVTMTLMKGIETAVEHPEVVAADIMGLKGEKREEYLEFAGPILERFKGPKMKTIWGEEYRAGGLTTLKEFAYVPVGFIGTVEAYVRPGVPTPVGAVIEPFLYGGRAEQARFLVEHPGYALGGLLGEFAQAKAIGWAAGKAWEKAVPKTVKEWLKFGPVAKITHKAKLRFQQFVPEYFKRGPITLGEVAIPPTPERISLKGLEATELAWRLTQAPRMGGVWLGRVFGPTTKTTKAWALGTLFKVSPTAAPSFLRELRETGLTPFVTQAQVTRMGIIPYAPTKAYVATGRGLAQFLFGVGTTTVARGLMAPTRPKKRERLITVPRVWQPTLAREREKFRPITLLEPTLKEREKAIPALIPKVVPVQEVSPTQALKTFQKQVQIQRVVPRIPTPQILKPMPKPRPTPFRWPEMKPRRRRERLFGGWFLREHPLPSPSEMARRLLGKPRKKRKRKRKKRKRRR